MFGRRYVYISVGWFTDHLWLDIPAEVDCTMAQIREAMQGVITIGGILDEGITSVSGMTSQQLDHLLATRYGNTFINVRQLSQAYDAMWAIALALNETENALVNSGQYQSSPLLVIC